MPGPQFLLARVGDVVLLPITFPAHVRYYQHIVQKDSLGRVLSQLAEQEDAQWELIEFERVPRGWKRVK